jgi:hypothetical protein
MQTLPISDLVVFICWKVAVGGTVLDPPGKRDW